MSDINDVAIFCVSERVERMEAMPIQMSGDIRIIASHFADNGLQEPKSVIDMM